MHLDLKKWLSVSSNVATLAHRQLSALVCQMMLYAKVVTIRDAQLNEKKVIQKEQLEEEVSMMLRCTSF